MMQQEVYRAGNASSFFVVKRVRSGSGRTTAFFSVLASILLLVCDENWATEIMALPPITLYSTLEVDTTSPDTNWTDGKCSLREALLNVNAHNQGGSVPGECEIANGSIGSNIIFSPAVFGSGGTIALTSTSGALPEVAADRTTIDGWSAGGVGYTGPPLVTINGSGLANASEQQEGLYLPSDWNKVRGLAIVNFNEAGSTGFRGISVYGANNWIYGNYFGLLSNGTTAAGNDVGLTVSTNATGTLVGTNGDGTNDTAERNVISANEATGLEIWTGTVAGNYIGTDASGLLARPNEVGVRTGRDVTFGGDAEVLRNVVSGNSGVGIRISDSENLATEVRGNFIGTDRTGLKALANGSGINVSISTAGTIVSGQVVIHGNVISGNTDEGIIIKSCGSATCSNVTGGHRILDNLVGLGVNGTAVLGNNQGVVLWHSPNNLLRGNTISGNSNTGLFINQSGSTGNTIINNLIGLTSSGMMTYAQLSGITLWAPGNTFSGNTIAGNSTAQVQVATQGSFNADDNVFSNNRIGSNKDGGYVTGFDAGMIITDALGTVLANNEIRYCHRAILLAGEAQTRLQRNLLALNASGGDTGVYLQDTATLLAGSAENCLEDNADGFNNTTGVGVTFESNWWGHASGPSGAGAGSGDWVSAQVDFTPWLTQRPECGVVTVVEVFKDGFESQ